MDMICKIKDCGSTYRLHSSSGLCNKHYLRLCRYGDPNRKSIRDNRKSIAYKKVAKIPLGIDAVGGYAIVDKEFSWLEKYKWSLDHGYARSRIGGKLVYIHHFICNITNGQVVDHINRNSLDNRLINLRMTSQSQNCFNSRIRKDNISGIKGVSFDKSKNKWLARIKDKFIGRFNNINDALMARKKAEMGVIEYV